MQNPSTPTKQLGFTLLELVLVIVILGVLAATAFPKFADLSVEAQQSSFDTIMVGFRTSVKVVHMKSLINKTTAGYPDVLLEGNCIVVDSLTGYPAINQSGACTPVAFISKRPVIFFEKQAPILAQQSININWSGLFISTVNAMPPPPPPISSELPSLLLDTDFTGWIWTQSSSTGVLASPEGLSFTYNQTTGLVN